MLYIYPIDNYSTVKKEKNIRYMQANGWNYLKKNHPKRGNQDREKQPCMYSLVSGC